MRMLHDYALCEVIKEEEVSEGGIVRPPDVNDLLRRAKVLCIGPGAYDEKGHFRHTTGVEAGDTVVLSVLAGTEIEESGKPRIIVRYDELLAVDD